VVTIAPENANDSFLATDVTQVVVNCGDGDDVVSVDESITVAAIIGGENGADTLRGGGGNDQLFGGDGNDVLDGRGGGDILDGENGIDTVDYRSRTNNLTIIIDGVATTAKPVKATTWPTRWKSCMADRGMTRSAMPTVSDQPSIAHFTAEMETTLCSGASARID